jgi:hypothetical protein
MTTFTNTKETKTLQTIEVTEQRDTGATTLAHRVTQPTMQSGGPALDTRRAALSRWHITCRVYNIVAQHAVDVEISPLTCSCAPYATTHIAGDGMLVTNTPNRIFEILLKPNPPQNAIPPTYPIPLTRVTPYPQLSARPTTNTNSSQ